MKDIVHIDQIETIIYSVLTNRPILIVGPADRGLNVLVVFLTMIPENYRWKFGYSINMPYFPHENINFALLDNLSQYDLETEVNTYLAYQHSLVNLYELKAYGEYSCNYTREIVESLQSGSLEKAKETVKEIYTLAQDVKYGESAQQFGDRVNMPYENADLIVDIASLVVGGIQ